MHRRRPVNKELKQPRRQRQGKRHFNRMTSKYFKLLRDSFNSFSLSNAAEQPGS